MQLLSREKSRAERQLHRDYETLRGLESDARLQAREKRGLLKRAHVLMPNDDGSGAVGRDGRMTMTARSELEMEVKAEETVGSLFTVRITPLTSSFSFPLLLSPAPLLHFLPFSFSFPISLSFLIHLCNRRCRLITLLACSMPLTQTWPFSLEATWRASRETLDRLKG